MTGTTPRSGTTAEVAAERDFLLERLRDRSYTWCGLSSDALVISAITGTAVRYAPSDWPDYWRCENTVRRAPAHLAARMLDTLAEFRALVAAKYPEEWDRPEWAVAPTVCDACDLGLENAHHDC